jgi:spermidine synthase
VIQASRQFFEPTHGQLFQDARVHLLQEDGRNVLLTSSNRYDVITIEVTSIWFAGAANLYSLDFYRLAKEHLEPDGVLQQWVQLHHTSHRTLATVMATLHEAFPFVSLALTGHQAHLLASSQPMKVRRGELWRLEEDPRVKATLGGKHLQDYVKGILLDEASLPNLFRDVLDDEKLSYQDLLSTDDNRRLEYRTPTENTPHAMSIDDSIRFLSRFRQPHVVANHLAP